MDRFLSKEKDEQRKAEELVARMMIRQNSAFTFFENDELRKMFSLAFPKLKGFGRPLIRTSSHGGAKTGSGFRNFRRWHKCF